MDIALKLITSIDSRARLDDAPRLTLPLGIIVCLTYSRMGLAYSSSQGAYVLKV